MGVKVILETGECIDVDSIYFKELTFCKAGNWRLWNIENGNKYSLLAGQFDTPKIVKLIIEGKEIKL
jgi:hypothetical protein